MMMKLRVLIACESSGTLRRAFAAKGHEAWSCDLLPADDGETEFHVQGDARDVIQQRWDLVIAHPPCTRLANSGVRWLTKAPAGRTLDDMWAEFAEGVELYRVMRSANTEHLAIENPVMHLHARVALGFAAGHYKRHVVQPWMFGDEAFKATGWELHGLPQLTPTNVLERPAKGTEDYKRWSAIHRASPGPLRWKQRSKSFPGMAAAIADQWGRFVEAAKR